MTNDDGIDSVGLHVLARALRPLGEVIIAAPDDEYSGYSAAFGPLNLIRPEIHETNIEGIDKAFTVNGPPALCVFLARLQAFGPPPDLVVSGINPGANVGRAVYHSGTVGAALTARNGGIPGLSVSQDVPAGGVEGQGEERGLSNQLWDSAAELARIVAEQMLAHPHPDAQVVNLNLPNLPLDQLKGWKETEVGTVPHRSMTSVRLEPKEGHVGAFHVHLVEGEFKDIPAHLDGGAVRDGYVSISWLSRMINQNPGSAAVDAALDAILRRA